MSFLPGECRASRFETGIRSYKNTRKVADDNPLALQNARMPRVGVRQLLPSSQELVVEAIERQPVPGKHLTWLAPSVEGKELCIGAASVVRIGRKLHNEAGARQLRID